MRDFTKQRAVKGLVRALAVILAVSGIGVVGAAPARAGSGGGCLGSAVQACISLSGGTTLVADLYMNVAFDSSRCTAYITIEKSNGARPSGGPYNIQSNGRRGPVTSNIITAPPTSGSAVNRVDIYTCAGAFHHTVRSKVQYYP